MRLLPFLLPTTILAILHVVTGLITLDAIEKLTALTNELRGRIVGSDRFGDGGAHSLGQVWVDGGEDSKRDEVEDTITAALRLHCSDLLLELEKPLDDTYETHIPTSPSCSTTIHNFHHFLKSTVKFLYTIQERQMLWRWNTESGPFENLAWLQGLWASRNANSQNRSFIEQQMILYKSTGCFGESQEVLKRNVEVVEYLNDLLDSF